MWKRKKSKFVETTDNVWYNGNVRKKYVRKRKEMEKCRIGFIHGSFDMFNVEDLKRIQEAKEECEELIVGVYDDNLILEKEWKPAVIQCEERKRIVNAIKGVSGVVEIDDMEILKRRGELASRIKDAMKQEPEEETEKKYKTGFIQGTFDMFHFGHLNLVNRAKKQCEELIVGVNTDELVRMYKNKTPIVPFEQRKEILEAIKGVSRVVGMEDRNKMKAAREIGFNALIMGNDWEGSEFYNIMEEELRGVGVDIVYLPYTQGISSTKLRATLGKDKDGKDIKPEDDGR